MTPNNRKRDRVPPRTALRSAPGNLCFFCGRHVQLSPGRPKIIYEWGHAVRYAHPECDRLSGFDEDFGEDEDPLI